MPSAIQTEAARSDQRASHDESGDRRQAQAVEEEHDDERRADDDDEVAEDVQVDQELLQTGSRASGTAPGPGLLV